MKAKCLCQISIYDNINYLFDKLKLTISTICIFASNHINYKMANILSNNKVIIDSVTNSKDSDAKSRRFFKVNMY